LTPPRLSLKARGLEVAPALVIADPAAAEEPVEKASTGGHGDSLQLYLREIGRVKLLTPKEEIALARKINSNFFLRFLGL